jgi:hypothetical protein
VPPGPDPLQVARTQINAIPLEMPGFGSQYAELSEENKVLLHEKSSLDDIVSVLLQDQGLERSALIFFYTSDRKKISRPSKQFLNSQLFLSYFEENKLDIPLAMTMHFAFDLFTVDVGKVKKGKSFETLTYKKLPLFVVVNRQGKILESLKVGGGGLSASKVLQLLKKAAKKKMNIDLAKIIKKQNRILKELVKINSQKRQLEASRKTTKGAEENIKARLEKFQKQLETLEKEEKLLWAPFDREVEGDEKEEDKI